MCIPAKATFYVIAMLVHPSNILLYVVKFRKSKIISLNEFTEALDAYTEKWSATDYKEAYPSILIKNTPKSFLNNNFYIFIIVYEDGLNLFLD